MSFGKGIPLASGFDYGAKSPLDSRITVETIEERNLHVAENRAYEGMLVYVKEDNTLYRYSNGRWEIIPTKEDIPTKISDLENDNDFISKNEVDEILKDTDFISKDEIDEILKDVDLDGGNCAYVGEAMPEDNELIWFSSSTSTQADFTYDNPIIQELFETIQSLQKTVMKLQEEVEYLKIYGGAGGTGNGGNSGTENKLSTLALEDGGLFLLEDGGLLLLENTIEENKKAILLLEDGAEFLLEDGSSILLEKQDTSTNSNKDLILLENGGEMLLENGKNIILE